MGAAVQPETRPEAEAAPDLLPLTPAARWGSPWTLPAGQRWFFIALLATVALALFVRLVDLDRLQNEVYGDIAIVYDYLRDVLAGKWPSYFGLSSGPLYHYLIAPLIKLTGLTYYGLKLASVLVSLGVLAGTYALSRRLLGDWFALVATAVAAVSSWLLIFSRLGNSQVLVPLLVVMALWLLVRYVQGGGRGDLAGSAAISALGLYLYPQSFVLPGVTFVVLVALQLTRPVPSRLQARRAARTVLWDLVSFILVALICAVPFGLIVKRDLHGFITGYIGEKILAPVSPWAIIVRNAANAALAFFTRGDASSRSNISGAPHVDPVSSVLLLIGIVFWLRPGRIRWSPLLFVPLVLLQVPSILVLASPGEVPSASRTLGVAPLVYILVASGLWWLMALIGRRRRTLAVVLGSVVLVAIAGLNLDRYFNAYIHNLPYDNTPVSEYIAQYIDTLPAATHVYLVGCCWRYGMPEPKGIQYRLAHPERLHYVEKPELLLCDSLRFGPQPAVMIWSDEADLPVPQLEACRAWLPSQVYTSERGDPLFRAAPVLVDWPGGAAATAEGGAAAQPGAGQPAASAGELLYTTTGYYGQTIGVRYSPIDIGQVSDMFDGKLDTLMRGADENPLIIELRFSDPISATTLSLTTATMGDFRVTGDLTYADGTHASNSQRFKNLPPDPNVTLPLPESQLPVKIARITIEELGGRPGDGYHIHVRELRLK